MNNLPASELKPTFSVLDKVGFTCGNLDFLREHPSIARAWAEEIQEQHDVFKRAMRPAGAPTEVYRIKYEQLLIVLIECAEKGTAKAAFRHLLHLNMSDQHRRLLIRAVKAANWRENRKELIALILQHLPYEDLEDDAERYESTSKTLAWYYNLVVTEIERRKAIP